jgi:4-hydroxy-tetrahydrodipicolinate synthase
VTRRDEAPTFPRLLCLILVVLLPAAAPVAAAPAGTGPMPPQEFKRRLVGPIFNIPTPFTRDLGIDFDAERRMIDRALKYDVGVVALTAGDSRFGLMSYDEIKEVTRVMVEHTAGRAVTIAATGASKEWTREKVMAFARYAEALGASALQVLVPADLKSDEEALVGYYREVAATTRLGLVLHGNYSEALLRKLVAIDSIVAMKEDVGLEYLIDRQIVFGDRLAIFPGGNELRFLVGYPYGCPAYYSNFAGFAPKITRDFWRAIKKGDLRAATRIGLQYDYPFVMKGFTHERWHAALEVFGVAPRYLRPPDRSYSDAEMKEAEKYWRDLGVRPGDNR